MPLAALSPARRRLVLISSIVLVVLVLAALVAALRPRSEGTSAAAPAVSQSVAGPVLLIPGYGGSTTSLQQLATALQNQGRVAQVVSLPDGGVGDLRAQAKTVAAAAQALLSRSGAPSIDVVGYSAGGVVARLWIRDDGGAKLVRRVVTLGSPQHGTSLADLGALLPGECPLACQQLGTASDVLAELNSGDETPAGPTFVSIWTTSDTVVLPPDSARLNGALNITVQSVCASSVVTHTQLPADALVQAMASVELAAGAPVPLTAADCARLS